MGYYKVYDLMENASSEDQSGVTKLKKEKMICKPGNRPSKQEG